MTEQFKTLVYSTDYTQYGGEMDINDFNTYEVNKKRIQKQVDALKMSSDLQKMISKKIQLEEYKKMTLEELRKNNNISNTDGQPSSSLTDKKWQKEIEIRKLFIQPYKDGHTKKLTGKYAIESGKWSEEIHGKYLGCTNWQSYCTYINDILRNIRAGQVDYCYFIYQILDLLKFHFNDLKTRYRDGYWEVWLDTNNNNYGGE